MINIKVNDDISMTVMNTEENEGLGLGAYFLVPFSWPEMKTYENGQKNQYGIFDSGLIGRVVSDRESSLVTGYQFGAYTKTVLPLEDVDLGEVAKNLLGELGEEEQYKSVVLVENPNMLPVERFLPKIFEAYRSRCLEDNLEAVAELEEEAIRRANQHYNIWTMRGLLNTLLNRKKSFTFGFDPVVVSKGQYVKSPIPVLYREIIGVPKPS